MLGLYTVTVLSLLKKLCWQRVFFTAIRKYTDYLKSTCEGFHDVSSYLAEVHYDTITFHFNK